MGINNFGFSFFVTIVFITASLPNNANSAAMRNPKRVWPAGLHLDASHWNNSCNLSWSNIQGHKMGLPKALHKVQLIVDPLVHIFNSPRSTVLNIHNDTPLLAHKYKKTMPQFNKTLPVKKLLRDIHKSVQQYVGLFHALSSQYKFIDSLKQNSSKEISTELNDFLNDSKLLLCEIETTLNVSRQPVPYFTRDEMQQKVIRMAMYLEKDMLIELDAFYSKKFFYEYLVDLSAYLKVQIAKLSNTPTKALNKKSTKSKEKHATRKMNNRKLQDMNNSNGSELSSSSAMSSPKVHRKRLGSMEKNRNNNKLNKNSSNSSNLNKKKRNQEGGKQRHRHPNKSTPSPAASI